MTAKIDLYKSEVVSDNIIHVEVQGIYDPLVYDLIYDIVESDYKIFAEGKHYNVLGYEITKDIIILNVKEHTYEWREKRNTIQ